jgi:hypothetical protein
LKKNYHNLHGGFVKEIYNTKLFSKNLGHPHPKTQIKLVFNVISSSTTIKKFSIKDFIEKKLFIQFEIAKK